MNRLTVFALLLSFFYSPETYSQHKKPKPAFYAFDENWKGTRIENARYIARLQLINDTTWQLDNYNFTGPLISSESYKDKECTTGHGRFIFYKPSGTIDSICYFDNGLAHGKWIFLNDTGKVYLQKEYIKGRLVATKDMLKEDSAKKDKDTAKKDEKESAFPGGLNSWNRYLSKNLTYPVRTRKGEIQGEVSVVFIVDQTGNIVDPYIYRSVEYSLDDEALRIISQSPKWMPAVQEGKNVRSYKRQPVIFRLQ